MPDESSEDTDDEANPIFNIERENVEIKNVKVISENDNRSTLMRIRESDGISVENIETEGLEEGIDAKDSTNISVSGHIQTGRNAIITENTDITIDDASITGNDIGFIARQGTSASVINTRFTGNNLYDILYYEDVQIQILDSMASDFLRITKKTVLEKEASNVSESGEWLIADPEVYRISKAILDTRDFDEKREYANELVDELLQAWDELVGVANTVEDIQSVIGLIQMIYNFVSFAIILSSHK